MGSSYLGIALFTTKGKTPTNPVNSITARSSVALGSSPYFPLVDCHFVVSATRLRALTHNPEIKNLMLR